MNPKCEPVDAECPAPENNDTDVWQSYKDYLKRKRDYKREWRKRKNKTDPPTADKRRRVMAPAKQQQQQQQQPRQQPQSPPREEHDDGESQEDETDLEVVPGDCDPSDPESMNMVRLAGIEPELQLQIRGTYGVEEVIVDAEEDETGVVVSEEDEYFLDRWNVVSTRIMSVADNNKRMRFLALIEGLVDEAW